MQKSRLLLTADAFPVPNHPMTHSQARLHATDAASSIPVTVIVLTKNEAINIQPCLASLDGFDDIIVVDSGSTDSTLAIVQKCFPKVRVFTHPFEDFGQQRNWAIRETAARYDWILFIDADEFMLSPLCEEIARFVSAPGAAVGAYIAGRNFFLGRWLKRCTFFPSYQLRLLKRGEVHYRREGHGQREVTSGGLVYLKNGWRHEGFSHGIEHWIDRHNRYSTAECELILRLRHERLPVRELFERDPVRRRRALKILGAKLPGRPFLRFAYTYFLRWGFLDGYPGFLYCMLRFGHDWHIVAKLAEARDGGDRADAGRQDMNKPS